MTEELWKDIPGYEGLYQASTLGKIRSLDVTIEFYPMDRKPYKQIRKGRILKPYPQASGYMTVSLYKDGEEKAWFVQRLVAMTFLKNPKGYKTVGLIDGDKTNTKLKNLKWGGKIVPVIIDSTDEKIIYYHNNNFSRKQMCEELGMTYNMVSWRIYKLEKQGLLIR